MGRSSERCWRNRAADGRNDGCLERSIGDPDEIVVWQFVAGCALVGAAIAGIASWTTPKTYLSTVVLRVDADAPAARELIGRIGQATLSQTNQTTWISIYGLNQTDRPRTPIDDFIRDLRARTYILPVANHPDVHVQG